MGWWALVRGSVVMAFSRLFSALILRAEGLPDSIFEL